LWIHTGDRESPSAHEVDRVPLLQGGRQGHWSYASRGAPDFGGLGSPRAVLHPVRGSAGGRNVGRVLPLDATPTGTAQWAHQPGCPLWWWHARRGLREDPTSAGSEGL